jgi:hypothetical protein
MLTKTLREESVCWCVLWSENFATGVRLVVKSIKELFCQLFCTVSTHGMTREHVLQMFKKSVGVDK